MIRTFVLCDPCECILSFRLFGCPLALTNLPGLWKWGAQRWNAAKFGLRAVSLPLLSNMVKRVHCCSLISWAHWEFLHNQSHYEKCSRFSIAECWESCHAVTPLVSVFFLFFLCLCNSLCWVLLLDFLLAILSSYSDFHPTKHLRRGDSSAWKTWINSPDSHAELQKIISKNLISELLPPLLSPGLNDLQLSLCILIPKNSLVALIVKGFIPWVMPRIRRHQP